MENYAFIIAGFTVGSIVGLTGVGGGSLMTPLLIFGFGIQPSLAVGTDLLFAAGTKLGGLLHLVQRRVVPWRVVISLSLGSIPASLITITALRYLGSETAFIQHLISLTLGFALLLTAAATFYKVVRAPKIPVLSSEDNSELSQKPRHAAYPVVFGALIGVLVTLTSVGAGAIGVTVLLFLYPMLPLQRIIASDIAYAVPLTMVAGLGHASLGTVNWPMLGMLLAGSIPGIWLGSTLVSKAPERIIRAVLCLLLTWAGSRLVFS
jgi:uncharacterized membrane protein YfcA